MLPEWSRVFKRGETIRLTIKESAPVNSDLASDLPVIPGLRLPEEPITSPTAFLDAPKATCEFTVYLDGEAVKVRDLRSHAEIVKAWTNAVNRVNAKDAAHERWLHRDVSDYEQANEDEPKAQPAEPSDLLVFNGDEQGIGAAAFKPHRVTGIVKS